MKRKILVLAAVACLAGAAQVYGQFGGLTTIKRPNIANIFKPVVGNGAIYDETSKDGSKSTMEMSVVDSEMVGTQKGYWMEVGHSEGSDEKKYAKLLVTPDDFVFHKMVMVMPGSPQPILMDMDERRGDKQRNELKDNLDKWHQVGSETITVPAGTFSCEHWTKDDGKGDVWVSSKVSPLALVKSVEDGRTMVLKQLITGAKTHITGTPVKFDPQMMMRQRQTQKP